MKRPLMGMGIALVAGAAAVGRDASVVCVFWSFGSAFIFKISDRQFLEIYSGTVCFLIIGFCRTMAAEQSDSAFGRRCLRPAL